MQTKKPLCLLLILVLALLTFCACTPTTTPKSTTDAAAATTEPVKTADVQKTGIVQIKDAAMNANDDASANISVKFYTFKEGANESDYTMTAVEGSDASAKLQITKDSTLEFPSEDFVASHSVDFKGFISEFAANKVKLNDLYFKITYTGELVNTLTFFYLP